MDHITQLKKIRAEAIARLRNSPDFRLAGKLGQLIVELGDTVEDVRIFDDTSLNQPASPIAAVTADEKPRTFQTAFTKPVPTPDLVSDDSEAEEMIDELVAEIEGDAAELDALAAETKEKSTLGSISSYFNTEKVDRAVPNGAAH